MTLSEFAFNARIFAKLGGVFFVVVLIAYFLLLAVLSFSKQARTSRMAKNQPAVTQTAYGQLPPLVVERSQNTAPLTFALDTIDNTIPSATTEAKIYFFPEGVITLSNAKQADAIAKNFGFDETIKPIRIDDDVLRYENNDKQLLVNQRDFHYQYKIKSGSELQKLLEATPSAQLETLEDRFITKARDLFSTNGSYGRTIAGGATNIVYVVYDLTKQEFVPVQDGQQPQAARVDFFRVNVNTFPSVSPEYFVTQNYVIVAPLNNNMEVVSAQYKSFAELEEGSSMQGASYPGTYPLLTSEEAWKALEAGKVKTVSLAQPATMPIKIRDIFIAYYDPESKQQYLQPVYVFLGSDNYVGYLPAVSKTYVLEKGT